MIYGILGLMFVLCCAGSYASFTETVRQSSYYVVLMAVLSTLGGALFAWGATVLDHKERIFVFSLACDVAMVVAYYVLPVALGGVKPTNAVIIGSAIMIIGFVTIKLGG